jgi:hypothetical protein
MTTSSLLTGRYTTVVALASNAALTAVGALSAILWPAFQERLATGLLAGVGLLLTVLVALDRRDPARTQWHWKPAAIGTLATTLLAAGLLLTRPILIRFDPRTSFVKVSGQVVSSADSPIVAARVWPDEHHLSVVVQPIHPACNPTQAPRPNTPRGTVRCTAGHCPKAGDLPHTTVGDILEVHQGTWEAHVTCQLLP